MNRRSVLKTVCALALAAVAPLAKACGLYKGARVIINGVAIELPRKLDITIEVDEAGYAMEPMRLHIQGGLLRFVALGSNPALHVTSDKGGGFYFEGGDTAAMVENLEKDSLDYTVTFTTREPKTIIRAPSESVDQ